MLGAALFSGAALTCVHFWHKKLSCLGRQGSVDILAIPYSVPICWLLVQGCPAPLPLKCTIAYGDFLTDLVLGDCAAHDNLHAILGFRMQVEERMH